MKSEMRAQVLQQKKQRERQEAHESLRNARQELRAMEETTKQK